MAGKNVSTEALSQAATALAKYINDVTDNYTKMAQAAQDCSDNMGSDEYSKRAIEGLQNCLISLRETISKAEELRVRILKTKAKIEESERKNW